jgi:exonuclease VII small subunit
MNNKKWKQLAFLLICGLLISSFFVQEMKSEEQCLKDAWKAYENAAYKKAMEFANKCIDEFRKAADRIQEKLLKEGVAEPPIGKVKDEALKNEIFGRGLLNDVATAYFIKGRSAEHLYRKGGPNSSKLKQVAEEAYKAACKYKHARTWDPKGWFWSPCQAASDRLPLD